MLPYSAGSEGVASPSQIGPPGVLISREDKPRWRVVFAKKEKEEDR